MGGRLFNVRLSKKTASAERAVLHETKREMGEASWISGVGCYLDAYGGRGCLKEMYGLRYGQVRLGIGQINA